MKRKMNMYSIGSLLTLALLLAACNRFDAPVAVWNPGQAYATGSTIVGVSPANTALAGVREISIVGHNFSTNVDSTWVYFGSQRARIKSISASTSLDTIVIFRPPNFGAFDLTVVSPPSADSVARYPYSMEMPVNSSDITGITGNYLVMEAGPGDTMWIASTGSNLGYLYKLSPDGLSLILSKDTSYLKPKIGSVNQAFRNNFVDMKFGPGGFLYATFLTVNSIYCMYPDSNMPKVYATLSANRTAKFDFDGNGNLYTGKTTGVYLIAPNPVPRTSVLVGDYTGAITFGEIRVIKDASNNKYVYTLVGATVAGTQTYTTLYRSAIRPDGTLDSKQLVYDITADTAFSTSKITSFNIASDGTVLLSLSNNPNYSLFVLGNGSLTPFYTDNILPTGIDQLIWGNGAYCTSRGKTGSNTSVRFYRMGMGQNGAPYLGRGLRYTQGAYGTKREVSGAVRIFYSLY